MEVIGIRLLEFTGHQHHAQQSPGVVVVVFGVAVGHGIIGLLRVRFQVARRLTTVGRGRIRGSPNRSGGVGSEEGRSVGVDGLASECVFGFNVVDAHTAEEATDEVRLVGGVG